VLSRFGGTCALSLIVLDLYVACCWLRYLTALMGNKGPGGRRKPRPPLIGRPPRLPNRTIRIVPAPVPTATAAPPASATQILDQARAAAQKDVDENVQSRRRDWSTEAVLKMSTEFHRLTGRQLYGWQQQVGEALLLGLNCTVIAPTGSGKTIPQILPLLASMPQGTFKMVLIISPLKDLQHKQVCVYILIRSCLYNNTVLYRQNVSGRWI
jgi:hypothetical protein